MSDRFFTGAITSTRIMVASRSDGTIAVDGFLAETAILSESLGNKTSLKFSDLSRINQVNLRILSNGKLSYTLGPFRVGELSHRKGCAVLSIPFELR